MSVGAPTCCAGLPEVGVGGKTVAFWTFDAGNVLKWDNEAGTSAWLQLCVLPGGPVFLGTLREAGDGAALPGAPCGQGSLLGSALRDFSLAMEFQNKLLPKNEESKLDCAAGCGPC